MLTFPALFAVAANPDRVWWWTEAEKREAARLTLEGIEKARRRVYDDLVQHKVLYAALRGGGWLKPAKWWRP